MSGNPLILSQKGFYALKHDKVEKNTRNSHAFFPLSTCYITRENYWENVVFYPTSNLAEVYKIVKAELPHISPVAGDTRAYIISVSAKKTAVLYCCFTQAIIAKATAHALWRLIPETLPLYRHLSHEHAAHFVDVTLWPDNPTGEEKIHSEPVNNHLLVNTGDGGLSSLLFTEDNQDFHLLCDDAQPINDVAYKQCLNQLSPLMLLDFFVHVFEIVKNFIKNNKHVALFVGLFFVSLFFTFIAGKSMYITIYEKQLKDDIQLAKVESRDALSLANKAKVTTSEIEKLNNALLLQSPKTKLLLVLSQFLTEEISPEFKIVEIMANGVKLSGSAKNSTLLLANLAKVEGVNNVEFLSPPSAIKNNRERFNIYFEYDERVFVDNKKWLSNEK